MTRWPVRSLLVPLLAWLTAGISALAETPRVLILGIDGCRPDALAAADTPHLDALTSAGIWFEGTDIRAPQATDAANTVSGPGWSNILTGVWPDKHGVLDNSFSAPRYDAFPHVFARVKEARPSAVTASFSTWKPIAQTIVRQADVSRHFPEEGDDYVLGDAQATAACVACLKQMNPDVVFLYLGQVDETGHQHGFHPQVAEYIRAIETVDRHVGELRDALRARPLADAEDWLLIVCTDHGGVGTGHGEGHTTPEVRETFLIVSGPSARRGRSSEPTYHVDVVPTALRHLGIAPLTGWGLDGRAVGLLEP
jgi:predicted AlkP superfamily pyrophosphatase or phosphodiesterase